MSEKATQFANFAQHDAHEFLSFLLDGLHEDLNRVRAKPMTKAIEAADRDDIEVVCSHISPPYPNRVGVERSMANASIAQ